MHSAGRTQMVKLVLREQTYVGYTRAELGTSFWELGVICKILHDHQLISEHQTGNSHSNSHAPDNIVSCKVIMSQWLIRPGLIWFNETKDMPCVQLTPIFLVYLVNFWINLSNKSSSNNQISWTYQLMNKNNKEMYCSMRYRCIETKEWCNN